MVVKFITLRLLSQNRFTPLKKLIDENQALYIQIFSAESNSYWLYKSDFLANAKIR